MSRPSVRKKGKRNQAISSKQSDVMTGEPQVVSESSRSPFSDLYSTPEFQLEWNSDIGHHIARNLIHLRQFRQLSQMAVAKEMGTSQPAVARIESGTENIGSDMYRRLIRVLKGRVQVWITPHEEPVYQWGQWWEVTSTTWNLVAGGSGIAREGEAMTEKQERCEHLWVRRRDGSWCAYCELPRFGVELSEEERRKLREFREIHQNGLQTEEEFKQWLEGLFGE